jgi:hypothetical protein
MQQRLSYLIPAGGLLANLLSGAGIEYIGRASMLDLYVTADAAGDSLSLTRTLGGDQVTLIPSGTAINVAAVAGAGPKANEDNYLAGYPIPMGAHLIMSVTGTAAHTGRAAINLNP